MTEEEAEAVWDQVAYGGCPKGNIVVIDGVRFVFIDIEYNKEEHRWADTAWMILRCCSHIGDGSYVAGEFYALPYDVPSTEMQEGMGGYQYCRPEIFPVSEVQTVTYKRL